MKLFVISVLESCHSIVFWLSWYLTTSLLNFQLHNSLCIKYLFFSLTEFGTSSYLWFLAILLQMYVCMLLFIFILTGSVVYFLSFLKILSHYLFKYFCCLIFFLFTYVRLFGLNYSSIFGFSVFYFHSSCQFSLDGFYQLILKVTDSVSTMSSLLINPQEKKIHSQYYVSHFQHFHLTLIYRFHLSTEIPPTDAYCPPIHQNF